MKTILLLFGLFAFYIAPRSAQVPTPVQWSFEIEDQSDNIYLLTATATIDEGWYLYSQDNVDAGPVPTSFDFHNGTTKGKTLELSSMIVEYSDLFESEVKKYKGVAVFTQVVEMSASDEKLSGAVVFMSCDDLKCLPPTTVEFDLEL